jgi:hypothetical protein
VGPFGLPGTIQLSGPPAHIKFLVPELLGITSAQELSGASICSMTPSLSVEFAVRRFFTDHEMELYSYAVYTGLEEFLAGECDAIVADGLEMSLVQTAIARIEPSRTYLVLTEWLR